MATAPSDCVTGARYMAMSDSEKTPRPRITIADVRRSIDPAKDELVARYFTRPIANLFTPLAYNSGLSGNAITYVRIAITVGMFVLFAIGSPVAFKLGFLFFLVTFVLDAVDGNIARLTDSASYWGKYVDGMGDAMWSLGPLFAGVGLWRQDGAIWPLMIGLTISFVFLVSTVIQYRFYFFRDWVAREVGPVSDDVNARLQGTRRWYGFTRDALGVLWPLVYAALLLPDGGYVFLLICAATLPANDILAAVTTLREASVTLRHHRRSRRAATPATPTSN